MGLNFISWRRIIKFGGWLGPIGGRKWNCGTVIVPCGVNIAAVASTKQNWIAYLKGNYLQNTTTKAAASVHVFIQRAESESDLREAYIRYIDSRVRSVAHKLGDFNLISKLSTGDMIALGCTTARENVTKKGHPKRTTKLWPIVLH